MNPNVSSDELDRIRLVWTDLNGIPRGTELPADEYAHALEDGVGFANSVVEFTLEPGLVQDPLHPPQAGDMLAYPDDESLVPLAWDDGVGMVCSDLADVSGADQRLCTRSLLRRVVGEYEELGYTPMVGMEPEFSLLTDAGAPINDRTSYDIDALDRASALVGAYIDAMETAGYAVGGVHQESQPGQYEMNIEYDDPVTTADGIVLFRHMLKSVSRRHGYTATMMPRPHSGEDANGMHFHLSLWDASAETNRFAGSDRRLEFPAGQRPADGGLSSDALHFIGGLIEHMEALTAVCNPTVNSYKRLIPGLWAPCNTAWGPDNRSTSLRVPPELGAATRVEFRSPDAAANPYLALAATLAAGLDGIRNDIEPPAPTTGNAYEETGSRLPRTLWAAVDRLDDDDVLRETLGEPLVDQYVRIKREEFDRSQHHVSEWERDEYRDEF